MVNSIVVVEGMGVFNVNFLSDGEGQVSEVPVYVCICVCIYMCGKIKE